jgi:exodeoxyribonuclease VII large subunit
MPPPERQPDLFGSLGHVSKVNSGPTHRTRDLATGSSSPAEVKSLTVTRLHHEMKRALSGLGKVAVTGEVHDVRVQRSITYFMLKERASQVSVTVLQSKARWCHVVAGETVVVTGMVDTVQASGRLTFLADSVVPVGAGAVAAMIERTREALRADGILDRPRRALPLLPKRVVVVCGNEAAVKHDFQTITDQRFKGYPVQYVVANQSSAESLVDGLERAVRVPGVEVIVFARGGGDGTQLLPYSDETLCRAIAACLLPVVTAIGHEVDTPLCDEVSDRRAPTPTAAAMMVIPDREQLDGMLRSQSDACRVRMVQLREAAVVSVAHRNERLRAAPLRRVQGANHTLQSVSWPSALTGRIASVTAALAYAVPGDRLTHRLRESEYRLAMVGNRVAPPSTVAVTHQLAALRVRVDSFSPKQVLQRGFAVVRDASTGQVVRDVTMVAVGDELEVTVAGGSLRVVVTACTSDTERRT